MVQSVLVMHKPNNMPKEAKGRKKGVQGNRQRQKAWTQWGRVGALLPLLCTLLPYHSERRRWTCTTDEPSLCCRLLTCSLAPELTAQQS